ncbi:metal-dependent hydrolase, partial [Frankia sp. EI5c]|uniref:metal-dependent hydrolase n=1 Tax=Frankia sp. EI5c TaxID=683316 RepID=UPI001F5BE671
MTALQVRRVPFDFEGDVPFLWNPDNPDFSLQMNATGVIAIAFEKYIVAAVREAIPQLTDPGVAAEADAFLRQEAQHASAHRQHMRALIRRYPGLRGTLDAALALYDELLESRPLKFHLAYIADLESAFTPTFKLFLDHEERLFRPGDERVASLFLWHFTEEVEHRSSGLRIYREFGGEAYRLRVLPAVARHINRLIRVVAEGFDEHVPFADRKVDARSLIPAEGVRDGIRRKLPSRRGVRGGQSESGGQSERYSG